MYLFDFQIIRPRFETGQKETLDWLTEAHTKAEGQESFREEIREKLWHVGCKPDHIAKRGHVLADFQHQNWEEMQIYRLHEKPEGLDLSKRAKIFQEEVEPIFEAYFPEGSTPPDDLIHVSCTGYVAPSGAQTLVSKRNWGLFTTVTHAYHMGCYGAIPAIRMGSAFLKSTLKKKRADIVHTEICSLHSNPSNHALDQLVSQSLFADGFIKYSIGKSSSSLAFKIKKWKEEIIPDSLHAMSWNMAGWGFQMSLSKEIAVLITRHLPSCLKRLKCPKNALFAVHPGGPKILTYIQKVLQLKEEQMKHSFQILKEYGNMSSATLPHIWESILKDPGVPVGTPIVSLAFGPGLNVAGLILEKVCGC